MKQAPLFAEVDFYCPDQVGCTRLFKVLAFLEGLHPRLGQQSPVRMLADLPLQLIANKIFTKDWDPDHSAVSMSHQAFLGLQD